MQVLVWSGENLALEEGCWRLLSTEVLQREKWLKDLGWRGRGGRGWEASRRRWQLEPCRLEFLWLVLNLLLCCPQCKHPNKTTR